MQYMKYPSFELELIHLKGSFFETAGKYNFNPGFLAESPNQITTTTSSNASRDSNQY